MGSPVDLNLGCTRASRSNGHGTGVQRNSSANYPAEDLEVPSKNVKEYLHALEDERCKIEGFKRVLPLCIQLLEDAIDNAKQQLAESKVLPVRPLQFRCSSLDEGKSNVSSLSSQHVLEEFMPLKRRREQYMVDKGSDGEVERPQGIAIGRPAWMAEAQLWTQNSSNPYYASREKNSDDIGRHTETGLPEQEQSSVTNSQLLISSKQRPTGAFLPFVRERPATAPIMSSQSTATTGSGADLSLSSGERVSSPIADTFRGADPEVGSFDVNHTRIPDQATDGPFGKYSGVEHNGTNIGSGSISVGGSHAQRKARRCWSPELHRRFVSALHQLGGSQVATPKQIRELMKVDGLTNDEVKSHLQKYRLHTRRPSMSPHSAASQPPQLVVLGGIWVPPEYAAAAGATSPGIYESLSKSPTPKSRYCQPIPPHEYLDHVKKGASEDPVQSPPQEAISQSQSSPQGHFQVTSQLSSRTPGSSSDLCQNDRGGEEGKCNSTSRKGRTASEDHCEQGDANTETNNHEEEHKRKGRKLEMTCGTESQVNILDKEANQVV